jgi:uncharacterized protein DUF5681
MSDTENDNPGEPSLAADVSTVESSSPPAVAENTAQRPRGRPFEPGNSGNPHGRPKGSRNKTTMAVEALLDGDADAITRKAIEKALQGDMAALRLCVERLLPARRDRPVAFELPKIKTAADALEASSAVVAACAEGTLSPREATEVMALIETHTKTLELTEFETRLRALEERQP